MTMHFRDIAAHAAADGVIAPEEISALRRSGWANGRIEPEEAEAIFAANHALGDSSPEWSDFFVEAIGEYVLNQIEPRGYVSEENAAWLIVQVEHDGRVDSLTEFELLVRLFEKALNVPESLRAYVLEQIEQAVVTGTGPTRCGGVLEAGNVNATEAKLMRRALFGLGSDRPGGISRREAELLFRIKDDTLGANNHPEWKRLFVQGVGNYLQGFSSYTPLSRERAGELEGFMNDTSSSVGRFMGQMASAVANPNRIGKVFGRKGVTPPVEVLVSAARAVTHHEQEWLDAQIEANGEIDEYDQALLNFLAEDGYKG